MSTWQDSKLAKPIREYYPVGPHETGEEAQWRTEVGWPIFDTGRAAGAPS
jgi:hypothetical protein